MIELKNFSAGQQEILFYPRIEQVEKSTITITKIGREYIHILFQDGTKDKLRPFAVHDVIDGGQAIVCITGGIEVILFDSMDTLDEYRKCHYWRDRILTAVNGINVCKYSAEQLQKAYEILERGCQKNE